MELRPAIAIALAATIWAACADTPRSPVDAVDAHCLLPTVSSLGPGAAADGEWSRPGPLDVSSTLPWPDCPTLRDSTASIDDEPRITFPADGDGVASGRWPVVIFGHANSTAVCNPTDRYRSLHEQWASWGWVVYAVDASEQNCQPYTVANMRNRIARHGDALADLRARAEDPASPFFGKLDLDTVVAAGHSRGGATAVVLLSESEDYVGAISLQGGNPSRFRLGDTFTTRPVLGITGELDRDLDFPHVDLTEELLRGRYSWHTLRNANHSFSADGLPIRRSDDRERVLPRVAQIELTKFLTTAYLAAHFGVWDGAEIAVQPAAANVLYSHDGDEIARETLSGDGFWSRWSEGPDDSAVWIDRFDSRAVGLRPEDVGAATEDPAVNDLGGANSCQGLARCEEVWTYLPDHPDTPGAGHRLASSRLLVAGSQVGSFRLALSHESEEDLGRMQARVRTDAGTEVEFDVVLIGEGRTQRFRGADVVGGRPLSDRFAQMEIPVEVEEVEEIVFELRAGALYIDDLRFTTP